MSKRGSGRPGGGTERGFTSSVRVRVMDRDLPSCTHDPSSSDSKSGSDGENRVSLGGDAGIYGFRILDVQNLRDGGDGGCGEFGFRLH